jgi:VanZ family protein
MQSFSKVTIAGIRLGVVALAVYWVAMAIGTHLPTTLDLSPKVNDKIKHFTAFLGLAILMAYITNGRNLVRRFTTIALIAIVYAAVDELTQSFIPGRQPDYADFVADCGGIAAGLAIYLSLRCLLREKMETYDKFGRKHYGIGRTVSRGQISTQPTTDTE